MGNAFPNSVYLLSTLNPKYSYWNGIRFKESLQKTQSSFQSWVHGRMVVIRLKSGNERMNVNSTKTEVDESSAIQCQDHVDFIFDLKVIVNKGFIISGQTLTHQLHFETLKILCENLRKLRQKIWTSHYKLGGTDLKKNNTVSYSFFFLGPGSNLTLLPRMNHNLKW